MMGATSNPYTNLTPVLLQSKWNQVKVKVPQREKTLKDELRKQEDSVKEEQQEHNTTKQDRQAENKEKTKKGGRKRKSDQVLPVFIDLETTGFGRTADILQIGARLEDGCGHNIVMRPVQPINAKASEVFLFLFLFLG